MNSDHQFFGNRVQYAADKVGGIGILAKKAEVKRQSIDTYINKGTRPRSDQLIKIAKAARINTEWLFTGQGPRDIDDSMSIDVREKQTDYRIENDQKVLILITKAAEVLESETIYRQALALNINSFHQAIQTEQNNKDLKSRLIQVEENNINLGTRLTLLEEKLSREDDHGQEPPLSPTGTEGM